MRIFMLMRILIPLMLMHLLPMVLCPGGTFVFAQEHPTIAGTVTDSKGVPIPGAGICISAGANKLAEQMTDIDGSFRFENVQPGAYTLTAEIVGFVKFSKETVEVLADSSPKLVIHLEPLPRPASPKVSARTSRQEPVQTLSAPSFQSATVTDLPGLSQFQQDLPQDQGTANAIASRGESYLFVSGNSVNLDAGNLSDPEFRGPMMDAARQMGFQIQEFGPGGGGAGGGLGEMGGGGAGGGPGGGGPGGGMGFAGRMGGGGRNASFKQPIIEGSITESYSNSALNARNYSLTGETLDKPVQIGNSFSLTVGGTIPFLKSKSNSNTQRGFPGRGACEHARVEFHLWREPQSQRHGCPDHRAYGSGTHRRLFSDIRADIVDRCADRQANSCCAAGPALLESV